MPNLKKQAQIYDDDDQPADESKSKIHMQQMANTGYDGFGGPQMKNYYQNQQQ